MKAPNPQSPNPLIPATSSPKFLDALVILALCLLVVLFLWPAVLPGRVLMPLDLVTEAWPPWQQPNQPVTVHNPLISDVVDYIYPVKQFAANAVRQGVFPLWNPYVLGGYPFTYNTQAGLFYPFSLLYYLLPGATAVNLTVFGQLFLGITFMYLYLRRLEIGRPAAAAGTIIFTLNGLMVAWLEWQVVHAAIIWLPLQLYLVECLISQLKNQQEQGTQGNLPSQSRGQELRETQEKRENPKSKIQNPKSLISNLQSPLLLSIAFALPWLGGHWNWTLYGSMTVMVYLLWRLWPWLIGRRRDVWLLLIFILAMGLALCLVQVLPAANYLRQGHRQPLPFGESLQQGLLNRFVTLLLPNFFGNPVDHNWWGPVNFNESAWYVGVLPLLLTLLLPFLRRDGIARFYLAWGGLGLLWALGTPAYGLLYVLPIFNGLLPSRAAILVVFCTAVLTALALDRLLGNYSEKEAGIRGLGDEEGGSYVRWWNPKSFIFLALFPFILVAIYFFVYRSQIEWPYLSSYLIIFVGFWLAGVMLLFARLHGRIAPRSFAVIALALIAADLFLAGYGYNTITPIDQLYPPTETGRFLQSDPEPFRIATLAEAVAYPPNTSLALPLANVSGYEPGILRRVVNFIGAAEGQPAIYFERELMPLRGLSSPLIDLLNVKYVVTIADWLSDTPAAGASQPQVDGWLPLAPGTPLGQSFLVPDAGLHRLDLRLRVDPIETGTAPTVTARIFTADGRQELAHATLPAADLDPAGWHSFYFTAFPSEWGRQFRFTVEADQPGVEVGAADSDRYLEGEPLAAGAADLAFATYYLPRPHLAHEDGKTRIYLNEGYFPRAFAVPQALVVANEAEALAALQAHSHQLNQLAILELEGNPPPPTSTLTIDHSPLTVDNSSVSITRYNLNQIELTTDLPTPAYIILADTYYAGWQAEIDGRSTSLYRANSILRAVHAPAGRHTLTFTFRPLDFTIGAAVSAAAWLLTFLLLLYGQVIAFKKSRLADLTGISPHP
jgi:hypothetical protein